MSRANIVVRFKGPLHPIALSHMPNITVRVATPNDLPVLRTISKELFGYDLPERIIREYYGNGRMYLLYHAGELIGISGWRRTGATCALNYTGIRAPYRRRGYGFFLVRYVMNLASSSFKEMTVETSLNRLDAIKLYMRLGFCCVTLQDTGGFTIAEIRAIHDVRS